MIYVCKGIGEICKLPCTICKGACTCCDEVCKAFNKACGDCCKTIKEVWAPIIDNPLAMFVLGTWAIQFIVFVVDCYAMSGVSRECSSEDAGSVQGWLGAVFLIGIAHCCFAFYLQRRLVADMQDPQHMNVKLSKLVWEILKRDIPFCLYFFFAIGAFCIACWGSANVASSDKCGDKVQTGSGGVVGLSVMYGLLSPCYGCCFVCGVASNDTVKDFKKALPNQGAQATGKAPVPGVPAQGAVIQSQVIQSQQGVASAVNQYTPAGGPVQAIPMAGPIQANPVASPAQAHQMPPLQAHPKGTFQPGIPGIQQGIQQGLQKLNIGKPAAQRDSNPPIQVGKPAQSGQTE